jgi:hypothetical protein
MSRTSQAQLDRLTEPQRLKGLYEAYRSPGDDFPAARGVLPQGAGLVVLLSRLHWEPSGEIAVPGGLDVWNQILRQAADSKSARRWARRIRSSDHPEELLDAMASLARTETDSGPLQVYLTLSAMDSARPAEKRLSAETVRLLAGRYAQLSSWYLVFAEFPSLSDESILRFVTVADAIDKIPDQALRGNAMGAFQANIGLWQILARQGEIANPELDSSWQNTIQPFARIPSSVQLLDAARTSLGAMMQAATGKADISQDALVELLAGPQQESPDGQQVRTALAGRIRSVLNDQRLVSLDTLFDLSDGLSEMAHGKPANDRLLSLAEELRTSSCRGRFSARARRWSGRHERIRAITRSCRQRQT